MKSISIYAVTRNQNIGQLQKLERQLSGREYFLKMRTWELESMKSLVRELEAHMDESWSLIRKHVSISQRKTVASNIM